MRELTCGKKMNIRGRYLSKEENKVGSKIQEFVRH